jgi:DNA-binding NarL/FixJ family response regulator
MSDRITVIIADDHEVVRAGLRAMLTAAGIEVIGEAADGADAVELVSKLKPRVVLMDLQMPELDGIAATKKIKLAGTTSRVVILTTFETEADVTRAVGAGATGYLLKDAPAADIVNAVRMAAQGMSALSPRVAGHLMSRERGDAAALSRREIDVLQRVAKGESNREIAAALRVSEATVKTHLLHVFEKLGVSDRTAAVTVAVERKILRLG